MNQIASLLVGELGRVALLVALAAVAVTLVLKAARSSSPKIHRLAWCAVLVQGWLLVRLPVAVPWYEAPTPSLVENTPSEESLPLPSLAASETLTPRPIAGEPAQDFTNAPTSGAAEKAEKPPAVSDTEAVAAPNSPSPQVAMLIQDESPGSTGESDTADSEPSSAAAFIPSIDTNRLALAIGAAWLAGICGCVALWLLGYIRFLRKLPAGQPADAAWLEQWRELLAQHGIRRAIPLRVTGDLGPLLCRRLSGYELLVPASLWRELTPSQRAAILRHELAHYRRADVWKSLAARVLALPQWFNPLAWLAVRRFDEAAEWACDQAATAGQPRATDYARALVRLGEAATRQASYIPAAQGRTLAVRVRRLLLSGTQEDSIMKKTLLIAAAMALVAVGLVRLELVAREPADDPVANSANDSRGDNPFAATAAEPTQETSPRTIGGNPIPQEPSQTTADDSSTVVSHAAQEAGDKPADRDYRAAAEAAAKAYEATERAYVNGEGKLDEVCHLSWLWMDAQRAASSNGDDRRRAIQAHLERMQSLKNRLDKQSGANPTDDETGSIRDLTTLIDGAQEMLAAIAPEQAQRVVGAGGQTAKRDNRAAADAAGKTYKSLQAAYETDTVTLDLLCDWSRRWLDAELAAAQSNDQKIAALEAYVLRTLQTKKKVKALFDNGARGGEAEKYYGMVFYLEDAKEMLKAARERAKTEEAKAATNSPAGVSAGSTDTARPTTSPDLNLLNSKKFPYPLTGVSLGTTAIPTNPEDRKAHIARKLAADRTLQEMKEYYDFLESEALDEEKRSKHPNAGKRQRESMKAVKEKIQKRGAQVEQELNEDFAKLEQIERDRRENVGKDPKSLRFDGRTFDQWREELLTELKPERRTEAILAFRSFAVNGYGRDAAQAIVEVMRGYEVWGLPQGRVGNDPEVTLKKTALEAFATIDRADAVPVLLETLKTGNAIQRLFAASIFRQKLPRVAEAAPALIAAMADKDAHVRQIAIQALAQFDPRPEGAVAALRKALKDENADVVIAAINALVPPQPQGFAVAFGEEGGGRFGGPGGEIAFKGQRFGEGPGNEPVPARIGPEPIFVPEIVELLERADEPVRTAAYHAIWTLGPKCKPALPLALQWLNRNENKLDRGFDTRFAAIRIVAAIGPEAKDAVGGLIKIVEAPRTLPDGLDELVAAIAALGHIGPAAKEAIPLLEKIVASGFNDDRDNNARVALDKIRKPPEKPKAKDAPDPNAQSSAKDRSRQPRVAALIQVKAPHSTLLPSVRPDPLEVQAFRQTQIEHLKSPTVIRRALREPGIAQLAIVKEQADPVAWLEKNLQAQYENDSEILRVQLASGPADEAAKVVNAVVKAYFDEKVHDAGLRRKADRDKLQAAIDDGAVLIGKLRTKKLALNGHVTQLVNEMAKLRNQVNVEGHYAAAAAIEMLDLETRLKIEKDPKKREAYITSRLSEDRSLKQLKDYLDASETEAVEAEKQSKSPDAGKQLRDRMKVVEEAMVKRKSQLEKEISESIRDVKSADLQRNLDVAKEKKKVFENQLEESKANFEPRMKELNEIKAAMSVEIDDLNESLKKHEALRAKMLADMEARKIEAAAPVRVKLLEEAQPPAAMDQESTKK